MTFRPLSNVVRRFEADGVLREQVGQQYRTEIIVVNRSNLSSRTDILENLSKILKEWQETLEERIIDMDRDYDAREIDHHAVRVVRGMWFQLWHALEGRLFSETDYLGLVYSPDNELLGMSFGNMDGTVYQAAYGVIRPEDVQNGPGAYRSAIAFVRSEMLRRAFKDGATEAEAETISPYSSKSIYKLGFRRDEL